MEPLVQWPEGPTTDTNDLTTYTPSTWSVLYPDGKVDHQPGEATTVAIRKALRGYAPSRIPLDARLDEHLHAWRAEVVGEADTVANYPARAILSGVDGRGLPADVLARLETFNARARR